MPAISGYPKKKKPAKKKPVKKPSKSRKMGY